MEVFVYAPNPTQICSNWLLNVSTIILSAILTALGKIGLKTTILEPQI